MTEALLLDFDGVMTEGVVQNNPAARLASNLQMPPETIQETLGELWRPYMCGIIDDEAFWEHMEHGLGRPIPEDGRDIWISWDQVKMPPDMVALVTQLRRNGLAVGLVSNATPTTVADLRSHHAYDVFGFTVISCETKQCAKPQPEIFQRAMEHLPGVAMHNVLFVDDQQRNVDAATSMGMQGILARTTEQIIADIRAKVAA
jgi:HAD superfamily hydrolase (TIGR01509 family)